MTTILDILRERANRREGRITVEAACKTCRKIASLDAEEICLTCYTVKQRGEPLHKCIKCGKEALSALPPDYTCLPCTPGGKLLTALAVGIFGGTEK